MRVAGEVDARVPRAKAAFHTVIPALAFLFDVPVVAGLVGLIMAISVVGGPRLSLFGRLYTQVIRPGFGIAEGRGESAAPHRFAEVIGAVMLLVGGSLLLVGGEGALGVSGWSLVLIVVALAALNAITGICVGCRMYPLWLRARGRLQEAPH